MLDIVILILLSSVIGVLIPQAKESGIRKTAAYIVGLAVLISICEPVVQAAERIRALPEKFLSVLDPKMEEIEKIEDKSEKWVIRYGVRNVEQGVSFLVENRFGLSSGTIITEAETKMDSAGNVMIVKLILHIAPQTVCDERAVEAFVSGLLACPCEAIREGG